MFFLLVHNKCKKKNEEKTKMSIKVGIAFKTAFIALRIIGEN